jgi:SAM-dependent methyltransferase
VVLERALIHHLTDAQLSGCFAEAYRILQPGGTLIVQDRTPDDCLIAGSRQHLRGYFFEKFPSLIDKEVSRRHSMAAVSGELANAGFHETESFVLWETRQRYESFADFGGDITQRTGRSLLHALTDSELTELVRYIQVQTGYNDNDPIEEQDRWTGWIAHKH